MYFHRALEDAVRAALVEDVGPADVTTQSVVPASARAEAHITAKDTGILCGVDAARCVFHALDGALAFEVLAADGSPVEPGLRVARVQGSARAILTAERTALNFVQHLSGIATATAAAAAALKGTRTTVLDTRKTVPGLRLLEKYAVRCGGGKNHRLGLFDGILIKNNHLKFASLADAVARARKGSCALLKVEVEVETLAQLREALEAGADIILLDNMPLERLAEALKIIDGGAQTEVAGKVTPDAAEALGMLGVDFISMGALTHSARALDFNLHVVPL